MSPEWFPIRPNSAPQYVWPADSEIVSDNGNDGDNPPVGPPRNHGFSTSLRLSATISDSGLPDVDSRRAAIGGQRLRHLSEGPGEEWSPRPPARDEPGRDRSL